MRALPSRNPKRACWRDKAIALAKENVAALNLEKHVAVLQGDLGAPVGGVLWASFLSL